MNDTFPVATRTVDPTFQPITLAELKRRMPVAGDHWDADLRDALTEGIERFEADTGIVCCTSTWAEKLDDWPSEYFRLQRRPVASISSITYLDVDGTSQTWTSTNYSLDNRRAINTVFLTYNATFPSLRGIENQVTITYVAGYASAILVPQMAKFAIVGAVKQTFGLMIGDGAMIEDGTTIYERLVERFRRASYP
jgi:uncharacterized phiE125 gp8 family phage protein